MKDLVWLEIPIERKKPLIWEFLLVARNQEAVVTQAMPHL